MHRYLKVFFAATVITLLSSIIVWGYIGYYSFPDIRKGNIVFNSQDNLWIVPEEGGRAKRISANPVLRAMAKISPSGEFIAYSAMVEGKNNIFIMELSGGVPKKLTFHPGMDRIIGWTRDSNYILFRSSRYQANRDPEIFKVSTEGGPPQKLNIGFASLISFSDDDDFIAFNIRSNESATWKRYMGGTRMDIWAGRTSQMDFQKLTTFRGDDAFPMIFNGRIYFISNRRGRHNIFSMTKEGHDLQQHTYFTDYDINFPSLGDDGKIVFQKAGDIFVYYILTDSTVKVNIELPSENLSGKPRFLNAERWIRGFDLSPDSKTALFEARGNLFLVPVKEGRTRTIVQDSSFRVKFPSFSNSGEKVAYFSDKTGHEQLYISELNDNVKRTALTENLKGWHYRPEWSPDDTKVLFSDEKQALYYFCLKTNNISLIDRGCSGEIRDYKWSPDGKFIAYAKPEDNTFSSIFIYDLYKKKVHRITSDVTRDYSPDWDPEGRYLYFLSARQFSPMIGNMDFQTIMTQMAKPYIVLLNKGIRNPLIPLEPEEQEDRDYWGRMGQQDTGGDKKVTVNIDFDRIDQRTFELPVPAGNYRHLTASKDKIFFLSSEDRRMNPETEFMDMGAQGSEIISYDLKEKEYSVFARGITSYRLNSQKDRMIQRIGNQYKVVRLSAPSFMRDTSNEVRRHGHQRNEGFIDTDNINLIVIPNQEWKQIFNEAIRLNYLLYWASNMANVEWLSIAQQYTKLLPRISTRTELNFLIGELIGELATGHTYIWGGDTGISHDFVNTGLLGADLSIEGDLYKIDRILQGDIFYRRHISPLSIYPEITEGSYIHAINGIPVNSSMNIYKLLDNLGDREVLVSISNDKSSEKAKDYKIKPISNDQGLRYSDWVNLNRLYVDRMSNGRIGYIHIPDMGSSGMVEFNKQYYNQLDKEGLIIDVRYNGGGFVSQLIIERLRRELIFLNYMRHSQRLGTYPRRTFLGHMVCLINERAGSDGDIFPEAFQKLGLGPLIGTTTWGGVIGIRTDKPFVDGGMMAIPEYAHYDPERGWSLENIGVDPDIEVINRPQDIAQGLDPQLDKGIKYLLEKLASEPIPKIEPEPYPDKSMDFWISYWKEIGINIP